MARRLGGAREVLLWIVIAGGVAVGVVSALAASFSEGQVLTVSVPSSSAAFGRAVAVSGDTMVAGAPGDSAVSAGVAHVFVRAGGLWQHAATLRPSLHTFDGFSDAFGAVVAIDGDTIAVAAPSLTVGSQARQGAVFVYVKPPGGWADMTETAMLTGSGQLPASFGGSFGSALAISGDTILVGSPQYRSAAGAVGAAYFFVRGASGWVSATETSRLVSPSGFAGDSFGASVALDGAFAAIGAFGDNLGVAPDHDQGAVYVYTRSPFGWSQPTPPARLLASDGASGDRFGYRVAMADGALVATSSRGVYLFAQRDLSGWNLGSEDAKPLVINSMALDVALSSDRLLIGGANVASPLVFARPAGGWPALANADTLAPSGTPSIQALAVSGGAVLAGAPGMTVSGNPGQGVVFAFTLPGVTGGAPVVKVMPEISRTGLLSFSPEPLPVTMGDTLSVAPGQWTTPRQLAWQWQRCTESGNCADVPAATGSTYTLSVPDVGMRVRATITGSNSTGSTAAATRMTAVVAAQAPRPSRLPSIHGFTDGALTRLAVTPPLWFGTPPFAESYRWLHCDGSGNGCLEVASGAATSWTPADRSGTYRVEVTGANGAGSASATSIATRLPVLSDLQLTATGSGGAPLPQPALPDPFGLVATPAPAIVCDTASGTLLPVGSTIVTCSQRDANFNTASATFRVNVNAAPGSGGTGGGSSGGGGGGGGSNLPDLEVTQVASRGQAAVGDLVTFTSSVVLKNFAASSGASNLVLTDALPAGLEPVGVSTNRGSCANGQTVVCNLSFIASGVTAQVVITAKVVGAGEIVNLVVVRADETDLDPANNVATVRLNSPVTAPVAPLAPPTVVKKPAVARGVTRAGTAKPETLRGTVNADALDGRGGDDTILGLAGNDLLTGGSGKDTIQAGAGNDTIRARDGQKDIVRCGPGADTVTADRSDVLAGCEKVGRR